MGKYYLENERQERLDLQKGDYQIVNVTGLGSSYESKYTRVGDQFVNDYLSMTQNELKFGVVFIPPKAFDKLQVMSVFLNRASELYLVYAPTISKTQEYRRDIDVVAFTQDQSTLGLLRYNVTIKCKSLFYTNEENRFLVERGTGEMRYNYAFPARFNDNAIRDIVICNDGHVEAPFTVELLGYTEKPRIKVFVDQVERNNLLFDTTIDVGEKLIYSSRDGHLQLSHIKTDGTVENIINLMDFETETFFKLPIGNVKVQFTSDTGTIGKIHFNVYKYYKVV